MHSVYRHEIVLPFTPSFVKSEQRRSFERKPGESGHEYIVQGMVHISWLIIINLRKYISDGREKRIRSRFGCILISAFRVISFLCVLSLSLPAYLT